MTGVKHITSKFRTCVAFSWTRANFYKKNTHREYAHEFQPTQRELMHCTRYSRQEFALLVRYMEFAGAVFTGCTPAITHGQNVVGYKQFCAHELATTISRWSRRYFAGTLILAFIYWPIFSCKDMAIGFPDTYNYTKTLGVISPAVYCRSTIIHCTTSLGSSSHLNTQRSCSRQEQLYKKIFSSKNKQ
jgi:hypothetical protein